ncbi:hypothetical protein J8F10_13380 [Gemmata sp. G18]|uniref:Uncharacterized protein n=1 Tax=Gemmata palustris TaxID=2822762 RepID=A0ABS5BRJ6_9BACT|nr:hypothetical protein [Gemmata palustris]MBP3956276.1 hypothetical protein [Gemmata palustris]
MSRVLMVPAVVVLILSVGSAAPVPKHLVPKEALYHAHTPGIRFAWDHKYDRMEPEATVMVVTDVDRQAEGHVVSMGFVIKEQVAVIREKVRVSDRGVALVEYGGCKVDPPMWLLKLPLKPGEQWETTTVMQEAEQKFRHTVGKPEWVEVPAGRFMAVPVVQEFLDVFGMDNGAEIKRVPEKHWYAPGIGCIKTTVSTHRTSVLKSISLDKK